LVELGLVTFGAGLAIAFPKAIGVVPKTKTACSCQTKQYK